MTKNEYGDALVLGGHTAKGQEEKIAELLAAANAVVREALGSSSVARAKMLKGPTGALYAALNRFHSIPTGEVENEHIPPDNASQVYYRYERTGLLGQPERLAVSVSKNTVYLAVDGIQRAAGIVLSKDAVDGLAFALLDAGVAMANAPRVGAIKPRPGWR